MKGALLALVLLVTAVVPQHVKPPDGYTCSNHPRTPADRLCKCHRTCALNKDTGEIEEKEDPACKVYCFRDSCECLSECDSH